MSITYLQVRKFVICLLLSFCYCYTLQGQDRGLIDSLENVLKTQQHDTINIECYYELGMAYHQSMPDSSILYFRKARTLAEDVLSKAPPEPVEKTTKLLLASSLNGIGYIHFVNREFQQALKYYHKSLEIRKKLYDKPGVGRLLNNIAVLYRRKGNHTKALEYYDKSLEIYKKTDDKEGLARVFMNMAYIYQIEDKALKASECYKNALEIYKEVNNKSRIARMLNELGSIYRKQGNIIKALEYFNRSLAINEELNDKKGISGCLNNIALLYRYHGDYTKALEKHIKSFKINKEIGDKPSMAANLSNIGLTYYRLGDTISALEYYNKSLEIYESVDNRNQKAYLLNQIGDIHKDQNNFDKAISYFKNSIEYAEKEKQRRSIATSLIKLGEISLKQNNLKKANEYANRAHEISQDMGYPLNMQMSAALMKEIHKKQGDYKKAYKYFEEEILMRDSIDNEANLKEVIRQRTWYEFRKKSITDSIKLAEEKKITEAKLIARDEQLKKEEIQRYALSVGILILLIFGIVMYHYYKQKQAAYILLSEKNKQINKKNKEITTQKDKIEKQHNLVVTQKDYIAKQNKTITDSINYAKRIQQALLPDVSLMMSSRNMINGLSDSFVLFKPKEIVSGDFYWANRINDSLIVAVADCTGHGVPGAFMSMLGISFLNEIVNKQKTLVANEILNQLRENVKLTLWQTNNKDEIDKPMDGINIVITVIDLKNMNMQYSGSFTSFYIIRDNKLHIHKTDSNTIGIFVKKMAPFTNKNIQLKKNDTLYMFSDGYFAQFDGTGTKRLKSSQFRKLLMEIHQKPMDEQRKILEINFEKWKDNYDQIDDVTVLGIRV